MIDDRLEITVGPAWHIRLSGHLDASTAAQLGDALDKPGVVVVDCSELHSMDEAGVAALIAAHVRLKARAGRLVVVGLTGRPLAISQTSGLEERLRDEAT
jgi:anti-anti-sigma factor